MAKDHTRYLLAESQIRTQRVNIAAPDFSEADLGAALAGLPNAPALA